VLNVRYSGNLDIARQACDNALKEMDRIESKTPEFQQEIAAMRELLADCTLFGRDSEDWQYRVHVQAAEAQYKRAIAVTDSPHKKTF